MADEPAAVSRSNGRPFAAHTISRRWSESRALARWPAIAATHRGAQRRRRNRGGRRAGANPARSLRSFRVLDESLPHPAQHDSEAHTRRSACCGLMPGEPLLGESTPHLPSPVSGSHIDQLPSSPGRRTRQRTPRVSGARRFADRRPWKSAAGIRATNPPIRSVGRMRRMFAGGFPTFRRGRDWTVTVRTPTVSPPSSADDGAIAIGNPRAPRKRHVARRGQATEPVRGMRRARPCSRRWPGRRGAAHRAEPSRPGVCRHRSMSAALIAPLARLAAASSGASR